MLDSMRKQIEKDIATFENAEERYESARFGSDDEMKAVDAMDNVRYESFSLFIEYILKLHHRIDALPQELKELVMS